MRRHAVSSYFLNGGPKIVLFCYIYVFIFLAMMDLLPNPCHKVRTGVGCPRPGEVAGLNPQGFPESQKRKAEMGRLARNCRC